MRIIVNADDLGSSPKVNAAIFALMGEGRIRSATVIPNGRAFEDAISRIGDFPACSFGIHLNTASGAPIGNAPGLSAILGPDGYFRLDAAQKLFVPRRARDAVLGEWRSQCARVRSSGVTISHIDSHHHLHTVPALYGVLKRLQRENGITRVRLAKCHRRLHSPGTFAVCLGKTIWNYALRLDGTRTADGFCNLAEFRAMPDAERRRYETVEIMVHPGTKAGGKDAQLLESEWWSKQMRDNEMISYNEL